MGGGGEVGGRDAERMRAEDLVISFHFFYISCFKIRHVIFLVLTLVGLFSHLCYCWSGTGSFIIMLTPSHSNPC